MPRHCKVVYDPNLSIQENADKCGLSVDAIRYYIRTRGIDRRYEEKKKVLEDLRAYVNNHPDATMREVSRATGRGINTVRRYWDILHGEKELQPSQPKGVIQEKLAIEKKRKQIEFLDKLPFEFLKEYFDKRKVEEKKRPGISARSLLR